MQAIILAAGMGKRLKYLTQDKTKCMIKVNGITLIERMLRQLENQNLSRIVIVVGYQNQNLIKHIETLAIKTPIEYVYNDMYYKTNNIYSLALAKDYLCQEDSLLLESDIILEEETIEELLNDSRENLALVDKYESWMDGACVELDEDDCIISFVSGKNLRFADKGKYFKTVNVYKFSKSFSENTYIPFLCAYEKAMGENEYYESVIKLIALLDSKELRARRIEKCIWYEIDDIQDLDIAESLFARTASEKYEKRVSRYGGYWRYPKMLDFCFLVNPYFPTEKMREEIKANFDALLTNYPSGMKVNCLLASRNFGIKQEHIVVGNGAAELIKELLECQEWGKLGIIRPTFEEYPQRYLGKEVVTFYSKNDSFLYTEQELIDFFETNPINTLVLINPDNPTGNYIEKSGILKLLKWAKQKNISLIIDESFLDFSNEGMNSTNVSEDILLLYEKLYVIKSIAKSHGVPGLRLGVLASSNEKMIKQLKKKVAIWNINSFGEYYFQIFEKYKKEYVFSLKKLRACREIFWRELNEISFLKPFPSQANYIMCEVDSIVGSTFLAERLLEEEILIKDLSSKMHGNKNFIRLAIRTEEENAKLIEALRKIDFK